MSRLQLSLLCRLLELTTAAVAGDGEDPPSLAASSSTLPGGLIDADVEIEWRGNVGAGQGGSSAPAWLRRRVEFLSIVGVSLWFGA